MSRNPKRVGGVDRHVGSRLRQLRKARGVSQEALAQQLGVTVQQFQKYERGESRIDASRLFDIAHLLDVPVAAFFEGLA
jgi:transcriptional regulator with XRE-family HTH domain